MQTQIRALPFCRYPTAADTGHHGVQPLPQTLPLIDFDGARAYRSDRYRIVSAAELTPAQTLQLARVVADSFAKREPQSRHIRSPRRRPAGLIGVEHTDAFGSEAFGPWSTESLLYWFIRLLVITDPTSPLADIATNSDSLSQSIAALDEDGRVMGGAFNETMPPAGEMPPFRENDVFLDTVLTWSEPALTMLGEQDAEGIAALSAAYPAFEDAYAAGRVGHHFMVARSDALPKEDAFELVAASAARYAANGFEYMLVEATNQWTGAACEALSGVRVHFTPFQREQRVARSNEPLDDKVSSATGFLSDKDSGSMFYVLRLL